MNPQLEDLACLYVLDRLDPVERAKIEAVISQDPALAELVGRLEEAVEREVLELPRFEAPAGLLPRIEGEVGNRVAAFPWGGAARWAAAALVAFSVSLFAVRSLRQSASVSPGFMVVGLDAHQALRSELPQAAGLSRDARFIELASLAERYWQAPDALPFKSGPQARPGPGYALYDPSSSQGFIGVRHLPEAQGAKRYHLWIVDSRTGKVQEAGMIPVGKSAEGLYFFSVPPPPGSPASTLGFFVTEEDAGGAAPSSPRGRIVLGNDTL